MNQKTREKDLRELIEELGRNSLELPDTFEKGWRLPLNHPDFKKARRAVLRTEFYDLVTELYRLTNEIDATLEKYPQSDSVSLAAKMLRHDLGGAETLIKSYADTIREYPESMQDKNMFSRLTADIAHCKSIALTMAYLASEGNSQYSRPVPLDGMEYIFRSLKLPLERITNETHDEFIKSQHYVAVFQLGKNAKNAETSFAIEIGEDGIYRAYSIRDNGSGIIGKDGKPLAPEHFGRLFEKYTTNGTGYGLQFVKTIAHMDGGYAGFVTKTDDKPAVRYDTRSDKSYPDASFSSKGTEFFICIPRSKAAQ